MIPYELKTPFSSSDTPSPAPTLSEGVVAKFAHDMASPLGGVMMALDMLEEMVGDQAGQQSLKIIQESVAKMKATIGIWRHIFSPSLNPEQEDGQFVSFFKEYLVAHGGRLTVEVPATGVYGWQARLSGILVLCISDRLGFTREGRVVFHPNQVVFEAVFDKGDLFERVRPQNLAAQQATRQVLPAYMYSCAREQHVELRLSDANPFTCTMKKG